MRVSTTLLAFCLLLSNTGTDGFTFVPAATSSLSSARTTSTCTHLFSSQTDYHSLTVAELKELVKEDDSLERGVLSTLKRKQDFIDFLEQRDNKINNNSDDTNIVTVEDVSNDDEEQGEEEGPVYFDSLGLCSEAIEAIEAQDGWYIPTPIQQLAIPQLLQSTNNNNNNNNNNNPQESFWCEAPTGSGKTAAFVLPLLQRLMQDRRTNNHQAKIRSLILCPTRELAVQIGQVVEDLASYIMDCNTMVITGGFRREDQIARLADWIQEGQSVDIVVATPGRLVDVLTRYSQGEEGKEATEDAAEAALERRLLQAMDDAKSNSLSLEQIQTLKLDRVDDDGRAALSDLLDGLQYLVLDEADRLLGRTFETEVNQVLDLLKPERRPENDVVQTWLFSATFPKLIEPRVDAVLKRLGQTSTSRISCANSDRLSDEEISATLQKKLEYASSATTKRELAKVGPASTIELRTIRVDQRDRTQALKNLWAENEKEWKQGGVLVFVSTRYGAEHVSRKLRRVGIRSSELHGKLDQEARARRLKDLQSGKTQILLATDLASRGLDVVGLSAVVNYDLPRSTADFVHRVGRTGRAGRPGTAITFVTPQTESHFDLIERRHIPRDSVSQREMLPGLEVDEQKWNIQAESARIRTPGAGSSANDLAYDRMHGGIKGKRKSKKDRLREKAAAEAAAAASSSSAS